MVAIADNMPCMAKRKGRPPIDQSISPGERSKELLQGRISRPLFKAFADFMDDYNKKHVAAEKSAFLEEAIRQFLEGNGWPIPPKKTPPAPSAEHRTKR